MFSSHRLDKFNSIVGLTNTDILNIIIFIPNYCSEKQNTMTKFGEYLIKKSIKKAEVSRKTGISPSRLSELALNDTTKLKAEELYLIALAIDVNPSDILNVICEDIKLIAV